MGRRTSGQITGLQSIGNVQASAGTLSTSQTNQNLTIAPNGTGTVNVQSSTTITGDLTIANQGDLRLREASGSGTNYVALHAAATMAADYTLTFPAALTGTAGFFLSSDLSGNLSWASAASGIPVGDSGSTATVHYPLFGTNAGSVPTVLNPLVRSNLSFVPSTGTLTTTTFSGALSGNATSATTATTATTANAVATGNSYQMASLGVGIAATGTSGEIRATNQITSFASSDAKFKENITDIPNALDIVLAIGGKLYDWTNEYIAAHGGEDGYFVQKEDFGVVAQDVEKVFPRAIRYREDGSLAVDYQKLSALAFAAIIELKKEIDALKGVN
jgi:hypothetical protein